MLIAMVIPIAILKNAARITVIASLSVYVDRAFLSGSLHRNSGLVFTPLGVVLCAAILYALKRLESHYPCAAGAESPGFAPLPLQTDLDVAQ